MSGKSYAWEHLDLEHDAISWAKGLWWDIQVQPGRFDPNMSREDRKRYIQLVILSLLKDSAASYLLKEPFLCDRGSNE